MGDEEEEKDDQQEDQESMESNVSLIQDEGELQNQTQESTIQFIAQFFNTILKIRPSLLLLYVSLLENPSYHKLFAYSSALLQITLVDDSGLTDSIYDISDELRIEGDNQNLPPQNFDADVILGGSLLLQVIEEALQKVGLDSKFAIAINDILTKEYGKTIRKDASNEIAERLPEFSTYLRLLIRIQHDENREEDIQHRNIKTLLANAFLKIYMELYAELLFTNHRNR